MAVLLSCHYTVFWILTALLKILFHQGLFFSQSARSGSDCPRWIIFLIGPIVVLNRLGRLRRQRIDGFWSATVFQHVKNIGRSLFGTRLSEDRSRQILPQRYRVGLDSARKFPTIFAKMRPIDQKKEPRSIGTKTILGEMAALYTIIYYVRNVHIGKWCTFNIYPLCRAKIQYYQVAGTS